MNCRCLIWLLPLIALPAVAKAVAMSEECIKEPIFGSHVCVYQTNSESVNSVFLVHGIGDNASRDWEKQIPALEKEHHVLAIDLPGFGRSGKGGKVYSLEKYADLIEFVASYYDVKSFDLVGHSMGAAVSLVYATKPHNRVKQLVLVDAAGILHRLAIGKFMIAGAIKGDVSGTDDIESYVVKIIEKFDRIFSRFSDEIVGDSESNRVGVELVNYDFSTVLDALDKPTLIVWGDNDKVSPLRTGQVLHYRINGSQLKVIDGVGHVPMKESSEKFNELLLMFLSSRHNKNEKNIDRQASVEQGRRGKCNERTGVNFTGYYDRIEVANCNDVTIENSNVGELIVFESRVSIYGSNIGNNKGVAINSVGSDIKMTTSTIRGEVAVRVARSRMDFAAVDIYSEDVPIEVLSKSRLICSLCRSFGVNGKKTMHDYVTLIPGKITW